MRVWPFVLAGCGRIGFESGSLGDAPLDTTKSSDVNALATGDTHACAVRHGVLRCWGGNAAGQLGAGDTIARTTSIEVMPEKRWKAVTAGALHTCAIGDDDRKVWCWGQNASGELGTGDQSMRLVPTLIDTPAEPIAIASKFSFTCAVLADTRVACWGVNLEGQMGLGPGANGLVLRPTIVGATAGWTAIGPGQGHGLGVQAGVLRGSGRNTVYHLGLGSITPNQYQTMQTIDLGPWRAVAAAQDSSCAIRADDVLMCWGENDDGELGLGDNLTRMTPALVQPGILDASNNTFHGCAVTRTGVLACWGRNAEGQLGTGNLTPSNSPVATTGSDWVRVSLGRFYSCAQRADASVWCTGENAEGNLGTGDTSRRSAWTMAQ